MEKFPGDGRMFNPFDFDLVVVASSARNFSFLAEAKVYGHCYDNLSRTTVSWLRSTVFVIIIIAIMAVANNGNKCTSANTTRPSLLAGRAFQSWLSTGQKHSSRSCSQCGQCGKRRELCVQSPLNWRIIINKLNELINLWKREDTPTILHYFTNCLVSVADN